MRHVKDLLFARDSTTYRGRLKCSTSSRRLLDVAMVAQALYEKTRLSLMAHDFLNRLIKRLLFFVVSVPGDRERAICRGRPQLVVSVDRRGRV
jgi:hypothetical protein